MRLTTGSCRRVSWWIRLIVLVFAGIVVWVVAASMRVCSHGLLAGLTHGLLRVRGDLRWSGSGIGCIGIVAIGGRAVAGIRRCAGLGA